MKFSNLFSVSAGKDIRKESAAVGCGGNLSVILLIWTFAAALIPNVWLSIVDGLSFFPAITNIVLPGAVYLLLLTLSRNTGKTALWFIILFLFASFQIVLLYMYGRSIIAVDMFLNVVTTNSAEIGELLGNLMHIIAIIIIIYLPPIVVSIVAIIKKFHLPYHVWRRVRYGALIGVLFGPVLLGCCYLSGKGKYKIYCDLYPVNIGYNLREAVARTVKVSHYQENVKGLDYPARSTRHDTLPETYVLVVGETTRGRNWQLNGYDRPTSPRLVNVAGLVNFPLVLSQTNTTHKSVPTLLSHLDAGSFGDSIYHTKSIISAFKKAGFHTSFFTTQSRNHSFIDFFGEEADTCIFLREKEAEKAMIYDGDLLKYLDEALSAGHKKQLIVLHTYGSHFNYNDRYPASDARFLPDGPAEADAEYRDVHINAYDNSVLYTSNLLADIIRRLENREGPGAMLYTSDHGEDIFDDSRKLFLHASPKPSYYQLHVPFIVWLNRDYRDSYADKYIALKENSDKFVASSEAFFHTAIDLAGIETPYYIEKGALTSNLYEPSLPRYLNDHNKAVTLSESGLLRQDYALLDSLGIKY